MDSDSWIALGSAIVAASSAAVALSQARRANVSASMSAQAARKSADADERMAALAEEQANKYRTPWKLQLYKGDTYALVNTGDLPEYNVAVSSSGRRVWVEAKAPQTVDEGSSLLFMASDSSWDYPDEPGDVVVSWQRTCDPAETTRTWTHPLPPAK